MIKLYNKNFYKIGLFFLVIFSGLCTNLYFLIDHSLENDSFFYFPYFQEHLFSINRYGEIAWWFPHIQNGWATDFVGILAFPGISPLFALISFIIWVLGRLGLLIDQYFYVYIFYYGFFLTGLFMYSISLLSKEIFKFKFTRIYLVSITAFSPVIITQLTEMAKIEPLIFFILLIFSAIKLFQRQNRLRYCFFIFSIYSFTLSINFASTFFSVPALLIVIIGSFIFVPNFKEKIIFLIKNIRFLYIFFFIVGLFICAAPIFYAALNINGFSFNIENISAAGSPNGLKYDITQMVPGNPLEFLLGSTPGVGFDWMGYRNIWQILTSERSIISYIYCGFTSLPFFIFGYFYSKRVLKHYILFLLIFMGSIFILCNYSPIMGLLYSFDSPLLSINHLNDSLFVNGGFLIITFGSALGLDTWLDSKKNRKDILPILLFWALISIIIFSIIVFFSPSILPYGGRIIVSSKIMGLYIFTNFIFFLIIKSWNQELKENSNIFKFLFIFIIIMDISTQSFIHISKRLKNSLVYPNGFIKEEINDTGIGFKQTSHPGHQYINSSYKMKVQRDKILSDFNFSLLPDYSIVNNYKFYSDLNNRYIKVDNKNEIIEYCMFNKIYEEEINSFINGQKNTEILELEKSYSSYNKINFKLNLTGRGVLFIKDSYNDFWEAKINTISSKIYPAFEVYKAILIPEGYSNVELEYNPKSIKNIMFLAYIPLIIILFLLLKEFYNVRFIKTKIINVINEK